jgi:antitoxin component YwqK of YwqJK toxin-antitoxin module
MKIILTCMLFIFVSLCLVSCSSNKRKDYVMEKDGLIYKYGTHTLYAGIIIDTADVIIQYSVIYGKKNGQFITHYLNGKIEKVGFMKNNMNEGEWKYFYSNGTLESEGRYENSKAQGKWTYYYSNGFIKTEGIYVNSEKEGTWIFYHYSGKVDNCLFYRSGELPKVQNKIG